MADPVAEQAADAVESVVEGVIAPLEAAVAGAEARAEAAEEALEAIADSARRDELHSEIEDVQEELEEWRGAADHRISSLETSLQSQQTEIASMREQLTEALARPLATIVSSIPPTSEAVPNPETPPITVTAITPEGVADLTPAVPAVREPKNQRRWT